MRILRNIILVVIIDEAVEPLRLVSHPNYRERQDINPNSPQTTSGRRICLLNRVTFSPIPFFQIFARVQNWILIFHPKTSRKLLAVVRSLETAPAALKISPFFLPAQDWLCVSRAALIQSSRVKSRRAQIRRSTKETRIILSLNIDGKGKAVVDTGIPFFDHMLTLVARHSITDLKLVCKGDLDVDGHHTVEDSGLVLGQGFLQALGDKKGIRRYGNGFDPRNPLSGEAYVPMDECLARCVIDFGGRPCLVWRGLDIFAYKSLSRSEKNQDLSTRFRFGLAREFFQAFANEARCNLHLELLYGQEPHHIVEGLFKAFAKALDVACQRDPRIAEQLPSTKGKL
jgi:imidazoleglycerol-phosphate dehydratase